MSSSSITRHDLKLHHFSSATNTAARNIVHRLFNRIASGRLVIQQGNAISQYGECQSMAGLTAHVHIHNDSVYQAILLHGTVGAGESFMEGSWSSPDLTKVIQVLCRNMSLLQSMNRQSSFWHKLAGRLQHALVRKNSPHGARRNIQAHYDLSNDFFALFLDPSMMYSSAIFRDNASDLEQAARYKMAHICRQLQLKAGDHLLEIGTGWGSMAIYAARHYGCRVTTTTISHEQFTYATRAVAEAGLEHLVTVLEQDYRKLQGQYDKLVSIEMIEAVGHRYYSDYFRQCSRLLTNDGLMLIQAITIPDQRYQSARRSVDFIQKYIFPGGALPSISVINAHLAEDTDMQILGLEEIGQDYAETLKHWRERFMGKLEEVRKLGFDDTFIRMWEFYLAYCEGGFRERVIGTAQIVCAKPGYRQLSADSSHASSII